MTAVIDPRCAIDPRLGDSFARQVASLLATHLAKTADDDADAIALQRYLVHGFHRFLALFPLPWQERILAHADLATSLGLGPVLSLDVGGVDVPGDAIADAIARTLPDLPTTAPARAPLALDGPHQAELSLSRAPSGVFEATISVGSETAHLDPTAVALSLPDAAARQAALDAIPDALDLAADARALVLHEIAAPASLAERGARLKTAQALEFRRHLDHLHARAVGEGRFDVADLALPAPEAIGRYLRLTEPGRAEPGTWLTEMAGPLLAELAPARAARRCGAIPFVMPEAFLAALAPLVPTGSEGAAADLHRTIASPAHGLLLLAAAVTAGAEPEVTAALLAVTLDRLERQAAVMAALLRKGARQLARSEAWTSLHPEIALSLLWVWADRMASTLAASRMAMTAVARFIGETEPPELTHILDRSRYSAWFYDYAFEADTETIEGAIAGAALRRMPAEALTLPLAERLLSSFGHLNGSHWHPKFDIAAPPRPAPAGMWIAADPVEPVASSSLRTIPGAFAERDHDAYVRALLAEPPRAEQPFLIVGLLSFLDMAAVTTETAVAIIAYIEKILEAQRDRRADPGYRRSHAIRAAALGRLDNRTAMEQTLADLARTRRAEIADPIGYDAFSSEGDENRALSGLLEMIIAYVRQSSVLREDKCREFAELAGHIVANWPAARLGAIGFLDRTVAMLPTDLAFHLWPVLLRLRAV